MMRRFGRTWCRLVAMLSKELGVDVQPEDIAPVTGYWRSNLQADCMRWEGSVPTAEAGKRSIGSWDTMTDCVRYGFTISKDHRDHPEAYFLVSAKSQDQTRGFAARATAIRDRNTNARRGHHER